MIYDKLNIVKYLHILNLIQIGLITCMNKVLNKSFECQTIVRISIFYILFSKEKN